MAIPGVSRSTIELQMPDFYGRPPAQLWERYFDNGMTRPKADESMFEFVAAPFREALA